MSAEDEKSYRALFDSLDVDKSGTISGEELKKLMKTDTSLTEADIKNLLKEADVDGDGQVNFKGNFN
jgi:Ca2+-binding EF-hand superfamily protein